MFTKRTRISLYLLAFIVLNVVVIVARVRNDAQWDDRQRISETKELSAGFQGAQRLVSPHEYYPLIGSLVKSSFWTEQNKLPLANAQVKAIIKFDDLIWAANFDSWEENARYLDGGPVGYREYVRRANARREAAISHGQRAVALGILTRAQAEFVMQRYLSSARRSYTLGDVNVQELLALTSQQKAELAVLWNTSASRQARLNLWSVDREEQHKNQREMHANKKATDAAAVNILDENQRRLWARLTEGHTLPDKPQEMPALTDLPAAIADLRDVSAAFRLIDADRRSLGLSAKQERLLKKIEEVTSQGLSWIGRGSSDANAKRRADFIKQAEEVALQGILTQEQEDKVREVLAKK